MLHQLRFLLCLACLFLAGCPTHLHHKYDCRGTLLNADGTPARGVAVHIETIAPDEQLPSKETHWWEQTPNRPFWVAHPVWWDDYSFMALTNESGGFMVNCNLDVDMGLWGGSDNDLTCEDGQIVAVRRPSPELRQVWVWIRSPEGWIAIPVQLGHATQSHAMPGNREIVLPPLTLPTTRPATSRATLPTTAEGR